MAHHPDQNREAELRTPGYQPQRKSHYLLDLVIAKGSSLPAMRKQAMSEKRKKKKSRRREEGRRK
jgi:hypothetical protein